MHEPHLSCPICDGNKEKTISIMPKDREPIYKIDLFDLTVNVYKNGHKLGSVCRIVYDAIIADATKQGGAK